MCFFSFSLHGSGSKLEKGTQMSTGRKGLRNITKPERVRNKRIQTEEEEKKVEEKTTTS